MLTKLDELLETITTGIMGGTNGDYGNKAPNPNDDFYNRGDSRYHTNTKRKRKKKIMKENDEEFLIESKFELQEFLPKNSGKVYYQKKIKLTDNWDKNKSRFRYTLNDLINKVKTLVDIKQTGSYKFEYDFKSFLKYHEEFFEDGGSLLYVGAVLQKGVFKLISAKDGKLIR